MSQEALGWVTACAAVLTAVATGVVAVVGLWSLRKISTQMVIQGDRERKWNTLAACRLFDHDPVVHQCGQRLWDGSKGGTDYTGLMGNGRYLRDAITVLNYLDGIAISLQQGIYVEEIVHAQFGDIVPKLVKALILGEESGGVKGARLVGSDEYAALVELCNRWSKPNYKPVRD